MTRPRPRWALPAVVLAAFAAGVLAAVGIYLTAVQHPGPRAGMPLPGRHDHMAMTVASTGNGVSGFQREMDAGMARMMQDMHAPGYSGNADIDFLAMMIPHHAGAIDRARLELQHGRDPASRQLAEDILAGQRIEIEGMTRRLAALRHCQPGGASPAFPALGGTRGP